MSLPQRLGRLRQISRIGSGGFATVWLYSDPVLDSRVAVKALADNWATRTDIRDRFLEEARILRRADSDNVVRVYDLGETDDGTPYFVMNYADRGTVADLLNTPQRDLPAIVDLVTQACTGLQRLHALGILHRDVKPQNLLLSSGHNGDTRLMVADLGVAKAMLHASGITQVVGTPAYMAPEQADPTHGVDARCDVHALGAVTYHLLTGRPMRTGGIESRAPESGIQPPSTIVPDLPASLDEVLLRAVAYHPEQRWPDMFTFQAAFAEAATQSTMMMYRPPQIEPKAGQQSPISPITPQDSPEPSAQSPVTPQDPPMAPSDADRRRANRKVGILAVLGAVALVIVVMGAAILWQESRDGSGSGVAAPSITLGDGWSDPEAQGDATWEYVNRDADLELVVSTAVSEESVEDEAAAYLDSIIDDGYERAHSGPLSGDRLGQWQSGWDLQYNATEDDTYAWRWYFGNAAPQTAGWVEVRGTRDAVEGSAEVEEVLSQARDDAVIGITGTD